MVRDDYCNKWYEKCSTFNFEIKIENDQNKMLNMKVKIRKNKYLFYKGITKIPNFYLN